MGEAVGTGGNVFEKLDLREITDEEIASFDRIYQGVDWGWFPDPFAFIRLHYDRNRETIYLLDEIYENKLTSDVTLRRRRKSRHRGTRTPISPATMPNRNPPPTSGTADFRQRRRSRARAVWTTA